MFTAQTMGRQGLKGRNPIEPASRNDRHRHRAPRLPLPAKPVETTMPKSRTRPDTKTRKDGEADLIWRRKYVRVLLRELLIQTEAMGKLEEAGPSINRLETILQFKKD
jgi:hypothetical protein